MPPPLPLPTVGRAHRDAAALLSAAEGAYSSYDPSRLPLDAHLEQQLAARGLSGSPDEAAFVAEVVSGSLRWRRFLSAYVDGLYERRRGSAPRGAAVKLRLLAYLAAFRLEELTPALFRLLVESQEPHAALVLLEDLLDADTLRGPCRAAWVREYDEGFVDETIDRLLGWAAAEAGPLLESLRVRVYGAAQRRQQDEEQQGAGGGGNVGDGGGARRPRRSPTHAGKPSLSRPRQRAPPELMLASPPPPRRRPPPARRVGPTREQLAIEAARAANRAAAEALLPGGAAACPFRLRVLERPMHAEVLRAEAEKQLRAALAPLPGARPPPPPPEAEVRLNAAAVLREEAQYRRKQASEAMALRRFEEELRDTAAFDRWQSAMREADEQEQLRRVELLRSETAAASGAAAQARAGLLAERAAAGSAEKQVRAKREEQRAQLAEEQRKLNGLRAGEVAADRAKARQAQESVLCGRRESADEVRRRAREDTRRCAEQAAAEEAERRSLIKQLRGLEKAAKATRAAGRSRAADPTEVCGVGANSQMSLAELRVRLEAAKQRQLEEEEQRRARILEARQARDAELGAKATQLAAIRRLASAQAAARKAAAHAQRARTADAVLQQDEQGALALAERLSERRAAAAAEAARVAAGERQRALEAARLATTASDVEARRFREVRDGLARGCERRQAGRAQLSEQEAATAARLAAERQRAAKQRKDQRVQQRATYDTALATAPAAAASASCQLLGPRKAEAEARRREEQGQRRRQAQEAYAPSEAPHGAMLARLQALAAGAGPE